MSEEQISKTLEELPRYDNVQAGENIKQSIIAHLATDDMVWCAFKSLCAMVERCPKELCWFILDESKLSGTRRDEMIKECQLGGQPSSQSTLEERRKLWVRLKDWIQVSQGIVSPADFRTDMKAAYY